MDEADERDWQQGFNRSSTSTTMSPLNMDPDCWDDTAILDIFDDAIRSHRTKVVLLLRFVFNPHALFLLHFPLCDITIDKPLYLLNRRADRRKSAMRRIGNQVVLLQLSKDRNIRSSSPNNGYRQAMAVLARLHGQAGTRE